ncbi:hypothetical protein K3495_g9570 [Podosphaera aphanis]|nr:hypothetical protein K3495_g9570 [Podosphaera aphanis]
MLTFFCYDNVAQLSRASETQAPTAPSLNLIRLSRVSPTLPSWDNAYRLSHETPFSSSSSRKISTRDTSDLKEKRRIIPPISPTRSLSAGIFQDGNDYSYFAQVHFGSKSSMMYMLLDTGASMTWVMGSGCKNPICTSRNTFGAQNSSTFKLTDDRFSIKYGTGECSGTMVEDQVSFAGLTVQMPFGMADSVSQDFENFEMYGILGLSFSKLETPSFLETIVASKALKNNMFAISLSQIKDGVNSGVINFGSPDPSRFTGGLKYYPLATDGGDWKLTLASAGFADTQILMNRNALLDTGTSYIFAPLNDVAKIHALVPGAFAIDDGLSWKIPCDTTIDLVFQFGSDKYSVPSSIWVAPPDSNDQCQSNLRGMDTEGWILGDFFLKNFYVAFDIDKRRIGLATAKFPTSNPPKTLPSNVPDLPTSTELNGPLVSDAISQSSNTISPESNSSSKSEAVQAQYSFLALTVILGLVINHIYVAL